MNEISLIGTETVMNHSKKSSTYRRFHYVAFISSLKKGMTPHWLNFILDLVKVDRVVL